MSLGVLENPVRPSSNDDKIKILSSRNVTDSTQTIDKLSVEEEIKQAQACKRYTTIIRIFHDLLYYSTTTNKNNKDKKQFSERDDVINKALLRSIKRFYLEEFRQDNKDLIKQRYKHASAVVILNGFKTTCQRLFGEVGNLCHISQFLMILSAIKPMNKYPFNRGIMTKADQVCNVMYKYSSSKFQKLFEIEEFEFVFRYIYDNHRDRIFKLCTKKEIENKEAYNQMLDTWIARFSDCYA